MKKGLKKHIIMALIIELVGIVIFSSILIGRMRDDNVTEIDLSQMGSGCEMLTYDGEVWHIDAESAAAYAGGIYLFGGPNIGLKRGTYTLVLNYATTEIQKGVVEVGAGVIDTTDYFLLSNNKNEVRYDFALKTDVENFNFRLKQFYGGDFTLSGMKIIRNTHDIRCMMFVWILLSVLINLYICSETVRNNKVSIAIVLGVALAASLPLFPKGMMTGDDIRFHFARMEAIADGLRSGAFPVRMYSFFNDDYGYPVPIIYGDILLYIAAVLRLVGFSTMQSYKMYVFVINLIAAATSYVCGKSIFKKPTTATIFSLGFTLTTYRLLSLYARAAVGEYSAMSFYPIIVLAIWNIYNQDVEEKSYKNNAVILAVGMVGLLLNHNLTVELVGVTLTILALVLWKKTFRKQTMLVYIFAVGLFLLIGAAFIVPFFDYYTNDKVDILLKTMTSDDYYIQDNGAYLSDYFAFFKTITGGDYINRRGLLTPGLVLMSGLVLGIILIVIKKSDKRINIVFGGAVISLWVSSTLFPWNMIYEIPVLGKLLTMVQFQYRYLGIAACFLSLLLCLSLERLIELGVFNKKAQYYVIIACLIMNCYFLSEYQDERYATSIFRSYDSADLFYLSRDGEFGMYMLVAGQFLLDDTNVEKDGLDYGVYGDNVKAAILGENGVKLDVYVEAEENATLEVPRFAYPYFEAKDSAGNNLDIKRGHNNKITVLFDKPYSGKVTIDFKEPLFWRISEIVSLITILLLAFYFYGPKKNMIR